MIETHDLFLRALAVPILKKKKKAKRAERSSGYGVDERKWPDVLVIDTEGRTTVDQSLTFGVWKRAKLSGETYEVIEEGIFYADDLPAKDRRVLEMYMQTAVSDVTSFPPRFPFYSRTQFMKKVFWPALKR